MPGWSSAGSTSLPCELLVEFQITKFIENTAARRYDTVQTVEKMSFDRENTSRGSTDYTGFRREFPHQYASKLRPNSYPAYVLELTSET
jgi:hypothetical protein